MEATTYSWEVDRSEGLAARGYFIPGGAIQRGGGQAPAFHVARCQTWSLVDIWLGPVGSGQGSLGLVGTRMGPYLSRTPIRVHRVIHQGSSGHIGQLKSRFRRVPTGVHRDPYLSRTPIRVHRVIHQGSPGPVGTYRPHRPKFGQI